ncbi:phosphoribosyltransferase family protein [Amycolatopsis taiwanensis]|uniref:Phosphoribosyl transferase n=1 Tax=Amycolatopsis taiwanensis TaxID=342230 RepID=A0A9W6R5E8_9PSEU|nr:phosphoribosyltransferase family protein [Amycolatopsis taiwanensis]GLY67810.1 putative phosphoribosyl transferase [Amycolatopsis taiwanensis]
MLFTDRADAGRRLAQRLEELRGEDVVVLGLPRGGVPVAFEVARALHAPLDVIVVRKLGVPYQPELALGAIGEGGVRVLDDEIVRAAHVTVEEVAAVEKAGRAELERRLARFRGGRAGIAVAGRTVVIVDDGVATGSTARAACRVARARGAARVVLAVPVGAFDAIEALRDRAGQDTDHDAAQDAGQDTNNDTVKDADEVVCLEVPAFFGAVGQWYGDFRQTTDGEVADLLGRAAEDVREAPAVDDPPLRDEEVEVFAGPVPLAGHLRVPEDSAGVVVFVHGSGSSRHSPRNRYVAATLNEAGLATLLFDLLTQREEFDRSYVFDIELLAHRLIDVTHWLATQPGTTGLPVGYFGASTGAGAALWAAADPRVDIAAVVSRGGRPDLARPRLGAVRSPTLLIVGERDEIVLQLNERAREAMLGETDLAVVPGATHLFEEPGALERVARLAEDWFTGHLVPAPAGTH